MSHHLAMIIYNHKKLIADTWHYCH